MNYLDETPKFLRDFLVYMQTIKGKSDKTVLEYFYDLRLFLRYVRKQKDISFNIVDIDEIPINDLSIDFVKKITLSDIYDFFGYTVNERNLSAKSRARKVSAIKSFFKYLTNKANLLEINPALELDYPKLPSSLPSYLSIEEAISLLQSIDGENKERNYAIITIFLNCGIRLSELVSINIKDIKNDQLRVVGKGNKERIVYLNDACKEAIESYLTVRPVDGVIDKNALFLSKRKKRISVKTVQWAVKKFMDLAGLDTERYSVHKLRHTAATLMYRNGVDVRTLQAILGHTSLATTQIYTHVSSDSLKNAIDSNPMNKIKNKTMDK